MFADPWQRTVAVAVWITGFSAGGAIGPLLGGVLLPEFRDPWAGRQVQLVSAPAAFATLPVS